MIWLIIRGFLDKKHVQKIQVIWGPASDKSPIPTDKMKKLFDVKTINTIEKSRLNDFSPIVKA